MNALPPRLPRALLGSARRSCSGPGRRRALARPCARWQAPLLRAALRLTASCRRLDVGERLEIALARACGMPRSGEPDRRRMPFDSDLWTEQEMRLFTAGDELVQIDGPHHAQPLAALYGRWWLRERSAGPTPERSAARTPGRSAEPTPP